MKANIRTIKDRDTGRHHFRIYIPGEDILIENRKFRGASTQKLAVIRAQAICARYGVEI